MSRFYSQCNSHLTRESLMNLLVAEDSVSCSRPGFPPLGAGTEHHAAVKALEAVDVVILESLHEIDQFPLFSRHTWSRARILGALVWPFFGWMGCRQPAHTRENILKHEALEWTLNTIRHKLRVIIQSDLGDSKGGSTLIADSSDIGRDSTGGGHNLQSNKITVNIKWDI